MRYNWKSLNKQQVGAFSEYFVKMEFTMYGFQVYSTEVDDRGIDFVTRFENNSFLTIQVKSIRKSGYVFMQKDKFKLSSDLYLVLAILDEHQAPKIYIIPSTEWKTPNELFVDRDYEGKQSKPEYGLNLSKKNMHILNQYEFTKMVPILQKV
ncbi:hypothetical protein [Sulfurimonas autotrophica]|uniref:DUF4365 domain-containing protein n=1 Tax=Sulfurimonas autotrophica (strain ATCC BAA-671 / DSM 16294 / JCM 11897 / OK10) TaxID=563040 RepID=E0URS9_SULAO|nr:hypothetical protein [Sulfurimonas autotrophica]ADN10093.1 hypothetical protein Saut_2050 [Sulfurimonas autotrophica DSM 16294]